jgi:hypothetical protein
LYFVVIEKVSLQNIATYLSQEERWMFADHESCELLRAIARSADAEQLHRLVVNVHHWNSLLEIAQEHRVLPMLYLRLADMGTEVPPSAQERLRTAYDHNMFHNLASAAELIAVLKAFEDAMIPAMPFKGVVLGASVYHDITKRAAGDLDLLIFYKDLQQATSILLHRGYELTTPTNNDGTPAVQDYYEYHFERPADGRIIELRWRLELTQPRFRRDLGMGWVWPSRQTTMLAGAEVPNMRPEITLLVLCMHGSKHVWSRLIWICDVARLLQASPGLDWKEVLHEAKQSGLWRALALGVLLAHRIAGAKVPEDILHRFESDTIARNLAQHIQENLFDAPGSTLPSRIPYDLQLLDLRDRARYFLSLNSLRPNERDQAALPLPKSLHVLYYLIRPFRLFRDRSAR